MAKVKRKRDMSLVSKVGPDAEEMPTLAQSIEQREIMKESGIVPSAIKFKPESDLMKTKSAYKPEEELLKTRPAYNPDEALLKSKSVGEYQPSEELLKSQSVSAKVKKQGPKPGENIFDPRIGYGRAEMKDGKFIESGREAVQRIMEERKAKVKKSKK